MLHLLLLPFLSLPALGQEFSPVEPDKILFGKEVLRLRGIDTPKLRQHRCWNERQRAERAIALLRRTLSDRPIQIERFGQAKGETQVILRLSDGSDVGSMLLSQGLAYPWNPTFRWHAKRAYWCRPL